MLAEREAERDRANERTTERARAAIRPSCPAHGLHLERERKLFNTTFLLAELASLLYAVGGELCGELRHRLLLLLFRFLLLLLLLLLLFFAGRLLRIA